MSNLCLDQRKVGKIGGTIKDVSTPKVLGAIAPPVPPDLIKMYFALIKSGQKFPPEHDTVKQKVCKARTQKVQDVLGVRS